MHVFFGDKNGLIIIDAKIERETIEKNRGSGTELQYGLWVKKDQTCLASQINKKKKKKGV